MTHFILESQVEESKVSDSDMIKFKTLKLSKHSKQLSNGDHSDLNHEQDHQFNGTVVCKNGRVRSSSKAVVTSLNGIQNKLNNSHNHVLTSSTSTLVPPSSPSSTKLTSLPILSTTPTKMGEFPIHETSSEKSEEGESIVRKEKNICRKVINGVKDNDLTVIIVNNINKTHSSAPSAFPLNITSPTTHLDVEQTNSLESTHSTVTTYSSCGSEPLSLSVDIEQPCNSNQVLQEETTIEMTSSSHAQSSVPSFGNGKPHMKNGEIIQELRKILLDCIKPADKRPSAAEIYEELYKELL